MRSSFKTERHLLEPLVAWLARSRRVGCRSILVDELFWSGRQVDLVTLSSTNRTTAYELKLNGTKRALEQAAYNRLVFDRAYVVTVAKPKPESLRVAAQAGVGVILITHHGASVLMESVRSTTDPRLRTKLLRTIREASHVRRSVLSLS